MDITPKKKRSPKKKAILRDPVLRQKRHRFRESSTKWIEKGLNPPKAEPIANLYARAAQLFKQEQFSSSEVYKAAAVSLERYIMFKWMKRPLTFEQITVDFLKDYELWMSKQGKRPKNASYMKPGKPASATTIGIYLTCIRYVYREAVNTSVISASKYPFGLGRMTIPKESVKRDPRSEEDVKKIESYIPENKNEWLLRDMWLFSYYSNGLNMADLLALKWADVDLKNNTFTFYRQKSRSTTKTNRKPIQGVLFEQTLDIIERWGCPLRNNFLFPIYKDEMTPRQQAVERKHFIYEINLHMKKIGKKLGLEGDLRSNVARHTFTNTLLRKEVPVEFLAEALGHSEIKTTQNYISRFPSEQRTNYLKRLID
jgi:integrase